MKILVADDDKSIRVLVVRMLEKIGVEGIIQAADGREALLQMQENTFDLVVTDWEMPWHSGLEIVRAIRASGSRVAYSDDYRPHRTSPGPRGDRSRCF